MPGYFCIQNIDYSKNPNEFITDLAKLANSNKYLGVKEGAISEIGCWEKFCAVVGGWLHLVEDHTSPQKLDQAFHVICEKNKLLILDNSQIENIYTIALHAKIVLPANEPGRSLTGVAQEIHAIADFLNGVKISEPEENLLTDRASHLTHEVNELSPVSSTETEENSITIEFTDITAPEQLLADIEISTEEAVKVLSSEKLELVETTLQANEEEPLPQHNGRGGLIFTAFKAVGILVAGILAARFAGNNFTLPTMTNTNTTNTNTTNTSTTNNNSFFTSALPICPASSLDPWQQYDVTTILPTQTKDTQKPVSQDVKVEAQTGFKELLKLEKSFKADVIAQYPMLLNHPELSNLVSNVVSTANKNPVLMQLLQGDCKLVLNTVRNLYWENGEFESSEGFLLEAVAELQMHVPHVPADKLFTTVGLLKPLYFKIGEKSTFLVNSINFVTQGGEASTQYLTQAEKEKQSRLLYQLGKQHSTQELVEMFVPEDLRTLHNSLPEQTVFYADQTTYLENKFLIEKKVEFLESFNPQEIKDSNLRFWPLILQPLSNPSDKLVAKLLIFEAKQLEFNQVQDLFTPEEVQQALNSHKMTPESRAMLNDWLTLHQQFAELQSASNSGIDEIRWLLSKYKSWTTPELQPKIIHRILQHAYWDPMLKSLLQASLLQNKEGFDVRSIHIEEDNQKEDLGLVANYDLVVQIPLMAPGLDRIVYEETLENPFEWNTGIKKAIRKIQYVAKDVNKIHTGFGEIIYEPSSKKTAPVIQELPSKQAFDQLLNDSRLSLFDWRNNTK